MEEASLKATPLCSVSRDRPLQNSLKPSNEVTDWNSLEVLHGMLWYNLQRVGRPETLQWVLEGHRTQLEKQPWRSDLLAG